MLSPRALPPLPTLPNLTPHSPLCYSFSACSDEVYALSMFKPEEAKFTSAITLAQQLVPPPPPEMKKQRSRLASFFSRQRSAAAGDSSDDSSSEEDSDEEEEVRAKKKAEREAKKAARAAKKAAAVEAAKKKAEEEEAARKAAEAAAEAAKVNGGLAPGFYSQEQVDTYVHLLYGLSKDFCASGLRVGALYTRNKRLQQVGVGWPRGRLRAAGGGSMPALRARSRAAQIAPSTPAPQRGCLPLPLAASSRFTTSTPARYPCVSPPASPLASTIVPAPPPS